MKGPTILLSDAQAKVVLGQFLETADHRGANLLAVAIMTNHFHLVVISAEEIDPGKLLGSFKSYGSRALNKEFGKPVSGTWWTARGSKRPLKHEGAVEAAINYVLHKQPHPLVTWSPNDAV